jgi:hypothetical protein
MIFPASSRSWRRSGATRSCPIWDLCHYGYPDDLDPFSDAFAPRFAAYAKAAAEHVIARAHHGPHFFTPINEITFFGYMAGEWAWAAPYGKDRETRRRLTLACARQTSPR